MSDRLFEMRQCQRAACRLRFPAAADDARARRCPRCGTPTAVAVAFAPYATPQPAQRATRRLSVLLDNVRSALNVGTILRTVDGAGLAHVYVGGITATPDNPKVIKTALSAEQAVAWTYCANALDQIVALQAQGQQVWVLEGGDSAESLFDAPLPDASVPIVLVVGHEKAGVDPAIVARADRVLHIPMVGVKESLNVAVALGIAAYWLGHQPQRPGSVHSA